MPIEDGVGENNDELVVFFLFCVLYEIEAILIKIALRILVSLLVIFFAFIDEIFSGAVFGRGCFEEFLSFHRCFL